MGRFSIFAMAVGGFTRGIAHVHHDDEAEVVVGADDAVDGHQNREPDQVGVDGGLEDVELAEEACGDGQAEERKQEEAQGCGDDRLATAEAGVVIEREVLFAGTAELADDCEGAEFYEGVAEEIEEDCGVSGRSARVGIALKIGDGSEGDQDVAGMGDRAIGQHALDVG